MAVMVLRFVCSSWWVASLIILARNLEHDADFSIDGPGDALHTTSTGETRLTGLVIPAMDSRRTFRRRFAPIWPLPCLSIVASCLADDVVTVGLSQWGVAGQ